MMTNAEAIETLRANYPDACFEQLREAVDAAIEALKVQTKAEWTAEELDYLTEVESTTKTTQDWVPVVRCEDCKHFHYSKPHGILIMNLVCDKWGKGCRTVPDGYCFMGERKDDEYSD